MSIRWKAALSLWCQELGLSRGGGEPRGPAFVGKRTDLPRAAVMSD